MRSPSNTLALSCLIWLLVPGGIRSYAQAPTLPQTPTAPWVISAEQLSVQPDATCALDLNAALEGSWSAPTADLFRDDRHGCSWVKASFRIPKGISAWTTETWMIEAGHHGRNTAFLLRDSQLSAQVEMGNDLAVNARPYPHVWSKSYLNVTPVEFEAGASYTLLLKYRNPEGQTLYGTNDPLAITLLPAERIDEDARLHLVFSGLMMGGLLLLCLYQLAQWTVYRTELDITYCLMLMGLMSYIMYDDFILHALFADRQVSELWLYATGSLGILGVFRFAQLTLRTVDYQRRRDRLLGYLVLAKAIEVCFFLLLIATGGFSESGWPSAAGWVPEAFRIALVVTLLLFSQSIIKHVRENNDKATRAFMVGNLSLVLGVLIVTTQAYILPYAEVAPVRWYLALIHPPFDYIIEFGIVGMALCFAFAVAMLTKEREALLERSFNRQLGEVEMKALRSQMNPHFLFNGLNSIKLFVISNQPREAADYLSKFARLIRRILENSKDSLIPLTREIETLELYLAMESLRFEERFTYDIEIDPTLDGQGVMVPPTLIQPYVENAIWHGLLHRQAPGGHLGISLHQGSGDHVHIRVVDNGVGRAASLQMRSLSATKSKSLGMKITAERIAMLKRMYGFEATVDVTDLHDAQGEATGTQVDIVITTARQLSAASSQNVSFDQLRSAT